MARKKQRKRMKKAKEEPKARIDFETFIHNFWSDVDKRRKEFWSDVDKKREEFRARK